MKRLFLFSALLLISMMINAQTNIISWTFPSGNSSDSLPNGGLSINNTFGFRAVGTGLINYSTNGVTTFCAQATNWDNGMNSKYWSIRFLSSGYNNLTLSCAIRSGGNNPGPRDFKVQYRILPNDSWTDVSGSNLVVANNWTSGVLTNLVLPAELNNSNNVIELRWVMTSNLNANGSTVTANGISKIDNVSVNGLPLIGSIEGIVQYGNTLNTPLQQVTVELLNGNTVVNSSLTDISGHYTFTGLTAGVYTIRCSSAQSWGGVNSADALLALKQFVGLIPLNGIYLKAADVNNNGYVNSSDALNITKRFTGIVTSFANPDWLFETYDVNVIPGTPVVQNILGLCSGDVNGSYIP